MGCAGPEVTSHKTTQSVEETPEKTLTDYLYFEDSQFMIMHIRLIKPVTFEVQLKMWLYHFAKV